LRALSRPSIVKLIAFDHKPHTNTAYLRMEWASTELSNSGSDGAVDLGDIICNHDGAHGRPKKFLPESFIWHVLFHMSAALSLCHYGIDIKRKKITEKADSELILNRLVKTPPRDLVSLARSNPRVTWLTESIIFSIRGSHDAIIHRDIKPLNSMLPTPLLLITHTGIRL
jgi:serine/threonine protein kinase